jgi:cytidylate kinase
VSGIHQIIDRQIRAWEMEAEARRRASQDEALAAPALRPWVTISRAFGSGGGEIAQRVAAALGYQIFDREILDVIVQEGRFRAAIIESLDERERSSLDLWAEGLLHGALIDRGDYLRTLAGVLGSIAFHGHAVIVGRGANFLLDSSRGLHVRIVAPEDMRIVSIRRRRGMEDAEAARRLVRQTDEERSAYIEKQFHRLADDPLAYDLMINTARIGVESAVDLIVRALRLKLAAAANVRF